MQIKFDHLATQLNKQLLPFYLLGGEEPLLIQQAQDQIRQAAKQAGFEDKTQFYVDKSFDWNQVLEEAENLSLFGDKKYIDIRLPSAKPGTQGAKAINSLANNLPPDTLIVITTEKLDKSILSAKWAKSIDTVGGIIQIWPVSQDKFPSWLTNKLKERNLPHSADIISFINSRTEGNLLAANQEIEKLALIAGDEQLSTEEIYQAIANSSRYDVYKLAEACAGTNSKQAFKILDGLAEEGVEPILILWAFSRDIRALYDLKITKEDAIKIFRRHRIFGPHQQRLKSKSGQLTLERLKKLLDLCHLADKTIKGMSREKQVWEIFSEIILILMHIKG